MRLRTALVVVSLVGAGLLAWHAKLFKVWPGARPAALALAPPERRSAVALDVTLPAVPVGMRRITSDDGPLLVHYWAPWERHARAQIRSLDSLRREPGLEGLRIVVVCFDPFPSVTRYVARQRLRLAVLLDGPGELRRSLPCPSLPFTYVIDRSGRIAAAQAGEVDWWAPRSRQALARLLEEAAEPAARRNSTGL